MPLTRLLLAGAVFAALATSPPASAQPPDRSSARPDQDDVSSPDEPKARVGTDTENLFGFTEGTDTAELGEREISLDVLGRFGKGRIGAAAPRSEGPEGQEISAVGPAFGLTGPSRYRAVNAKLGYQYGLTDDISVEFGLFGDARRVRNVPDLPDKSFAAFDGASVEVKGRILERTQENPLGLAVVVEPRYGRVSDPEGRGQDAFSLETRLLADLRLVPDRLWFATNLGFEPEVGRLRGSGEVERQSTLSWSGALAAGIGENTFIGAELRYLRAYEGSFLNRLQGEALFLGPTLHHRFSKDAFVTLAYSGQVAGRDRRPDTPERSLDLAQFERHNLRLNVGLQF